ncbi:MAG TPA: hypothetical protein VNW94_15820 [Streptosporangiaceae bacterium]|nr:hypothetical protein [Streptosporangiaceae bacterium]
MTRRTFFRHFTGKREVLLEASPPNGPLALLRRAFRAVIGSRGRTGHLPVLPRIRPGAARELAGLASPHGAVTGAFAARGIPERQAAFAARVGGQFWSR